jgi:hypothetical protein
MKTTRLARGLAAAALLVSAAVLAAVDASPTNPLHPAAFHVNKFGMLTTTSDTPMLGRADFSPTNPLHPAFYANSGPWVGAKASLNMEVDKLWNPLHPKYKR